MRDAEALLLSYLGRLPGVDLLDDVYERIDEPGAQRRLRSDDRQLQRAILEVLTKVGSDAKSIPEYVVFAGAFDEDRLGDCEELGLTMAAGLEAGIF